MLDTVEFCLFIAGTVWSSTQQINGFTFRVGEHGLKPQTCRVEVEADPCAQMYGGFPKQMRALNKKAICSKHHIVATARRAAPKPYLQKAKRRKHGEVARDSQVEQLSETSGSGSVRMLTRAGRNGYAAVRRAVSFLSERHAVKLLKTVSLVATVSAVAALLRLTR